MGMIWDWYRFLLHVPLGIAVYQVAKKRPMAALSLTILFIAYELSEDEHIQDHAYKDLQGAIGGLILNMLTDLAKDITKTDKNLEFCPSAEAEDR